MIAFARMWRYVNWGGKMRNTELLHNTLEGEFGILGSVPTRRNPLPSLRKMLRDAKQSILLTMSYFAPPDELVEELCRAARRRVKVRLMLPAECDVSIRPGWFWHERENARVKTPAQLVKLYYESVGRGANLLLNVPPNRQGVLSLEDMASLKAFGEYRHATFGVNLAERARRKGDTVELRNAATFNVIRLREDIRYGQRVDGVAVDIQEGGAWREIAAVTSVGPRRLIRLEKPVRTQRLRLRAKQTTATPLWSEFALFSEPSLTPP